MTIFLFDQYYMPPLHLISDFKIEGLILSLKHFFMIFFKCKMLLFFIQCNVLYSHLQHLNIYITFDILYIEKLSQY